MISSNDARLIEKIRSPVDSTGTADVQAHTDYYQHTDSRKHTDYYQELNDPKHYNFNDHTDNNKHTDQPLARKRDDATARHDDVAVSTNAMLEAFDRFEQILGIREEELHRDVGARLDEIVNVMIARMTAMEERIAALETTRASVPKR